MGTVSALTPSAAAIVDRIQVAPAPARAQALVDTVQTGEAAGKGVGSALGKGLAGVAGGAVGLVTANLGAAGARTVGSLATQLLIMALPRIQVSPQLAQLLGQVLALGTAGGALLAAGAGVLTGAGIAFQAASGAQKVDDAQKPAFNPEKKPGVLTRWGDEIRESGAELRAHLADVHGAQGFGDAARAGFQAGSVYGGHVGGVAGKVQGGLMGAAVGTIAALPAAVIVNSFVPLSLTGMGLVAVPFAIAGGLAGATLGEHVGSFVGSVAAGAVGAAGSTLYHAGHRLVGGQQEG
jgi:hypothetical protein